MLASILSLALSALAPPAPVSAFQVAEIAKVHGSTTNAADLAGFAVGASEQTALVGAYANGDAASTAGAVFVFERAAGGGWSEVQKLTASTFNAGASFGRSVDLSGDRAIVGAPHHDGPTGTNQGAAYVFERVGGTWTEVAELLALDALAFDELGWSVAIDGDYAAVGTYKNDDVAQLAGAVYVFERSAGAWTQVDKLYASDASESDDFGWSVALSGATLAVGADRAGPPGNGAGAVYVFERVGGAWTETQKLVSADTIPLDYFGWSVDLDGDVLAIGAYNAESAGDPFGWDEGAVYVYERLGGTWTQTASLYASDADSTDELGYDVAVSGDRLLAGAWNEDELGSNAGAAYLFARDGAGGWVEVEKILAGDGQSGDLFGRAVALSGDNVVVGASGEDDAGSNGGAAYLLDVEPLSGPGAPISLLAGGAQALALDAGHAHAGDLYWVLGSVSGTTPGLPAGPGLTLPLNPDFYFNLSINKPNQVPLLASFASLDTVGHGAATFLLPAGTDPALAGFVVNHAFLAIDPVVLTATFVSNALPVSLVP